jgi:hypothetical protein
MLRRIAAFGIVVVAFVASGCVSVPMASADKDASAKTFATKPGKGNIYVYRNEMLGAAQKMSVMFDGKIVGETASKTYFLFEVAPGKHELISKGENDSVLAVTVQDGRNYFVWQEMKMGMLVPRTLLHLVDETTGRAGVAECKLIEPMP